MSPTRKSHGDLTFLFCGNCVNVRVFTICVSDPNRQQDLLCKETLEMVRLIPILSQFSMWLKASQGVSRRFKAFQGVSFPWLKRFTSLAVHQVAGAKTVNPRSTNSSAKCAMSKREQSRPWTKTTAPSIAHKCRQYREKCWACFELIWIEFWIS